MILVVTVIVCVLFAVTACFILYQLGVVPGAPGSTEQPSWTRREARTRTPLQEARGGDREWPQGCLVALVVGATTWFLLWGLVLVFALRVLSDPFS